VREATFDSGEGHDRGTEHDQPLSARRRGRYRDFAAAPEAKAQQAQDLQQIQTQIQEMQATIQALQKQVADAKAQAAAANATVRMPGAAISI
jgi:hypothetical protein